MDPVSPSLPRNNTIIPPKGWTTDKKSLDEEFWGNGVAKSYGLELAQPIMCSDPRSKPSNSDYMFQSGSKYYIWNPLAGTVWEIVTSMDLVDIIAELGKRRGGSLKFAKLSQI